MPVPYQGTDYRWYEDRPVNGNDFNKMSEVAIFAGPVMDMYGTVSARELKILLDRGEKFVLLDVLDGDSFEKERIPGSINIAVDSLERDAPAIIGKDELVIVYSEGPMCGANAVGADKLSTIGYKSVMRFKGGLKEWKDAGYPVEGKGVFIMERPEGVMEEAARKAA
jgi:rhodanese-related sulfurtransferase